MFALRLPTSDVSAGRHATRVDPPDVTKFLAALQALPDVRDEAVRAAAEGVASGDAFTPAAARETAEAVLDDLPRS